MDHWTNYRDHVGSREGKHFKTELFRSDRLLLGLNCLEPGQTQSTHTHEGQDKFYLVQEGVGVFTVGSDQVEGVDGDVIWAPSGIEHGVENKGAERLVLIVGIAPAPRT